MPFQISDRCRITKKHRVNEAGPEGPAFLRGSFVASRTTHGEMRSIILCTTEEKYKARKRPGREGAPCTEQF